MDSNSLLLNQLRIDRHDDQRFSGHRWRPRLLTLAAIAVLAIGAVVWSVFGNQVETPRRVADERVANAIPRTPKRTMPASAGVAVLETSGYVVARRQATVSSKATGRVAEVLIEEGQSVERDQIIARLDSSNTSAALAEAQARLALAKADQDAAGTAADDAYRLYHRSELQHAAGLISGQAFDNDKAAYNATRTNIAIKERAVAVARAQLVLAERNDEDMIIRAPFAGIVTVKAAQPGEIVSPLSASSGFARTGIGTIVDMDSMEVEVDVSESFIARVHPGQAAIVRLNAYPDSDIAAEIVAVIPAADRSKASVRVRVGIRQKDPRILPDMGVKVTFLSD